MTPQPAKSQQQQVEERQTQILDGLVKLTNFAENTISAQARIETVVSGMDKRLERLEKAFYGNGEPGIHEQISEHERRVTEIEAFEKKCQIETVCDDVDKIKLRHEAEDKTAEKKETTEAARQAEFRKFYFALAATFLAAVIDLIRNLFIK
jgi:hypothetical protein